MKTLDQGYSENLISRGYIFGGIDMIELLLDVKDVSEVLKFRENKIRQLLQKGKLKGFKFNVRGDWRIIASDLALYIRESEKIQHGQSKKKKI